MATRSMLAPGETYHIYNRGTEKRKIFLNKRDYERFVALLYLANSTIPIRIDNIERNERGRTLLTRVFEQERGEPLVSIGAYCIMPNHFHLLLTQKTENGISKFLQKLSTAYTMYFNKKYNRSGALFQGKFKSRHADNDRYLKYLLAYIHLNPAEITDPSTYLYSSYIDFVEKGRPVACILDTSSLPKYFPDSKAFAKEMNEWLAYKNETNLT